MPRTRPAAPAVRRCPRRGQINAGAYTSFGAARSPRSCRWGGEVQLGSAGLQRQSCARVVQTPGAGLSLFFFHTPVEVIAARQIISQQHHGVLFVHLITFSSADNVNTEPGPFPVHELLSSINVQLKRTRKLLLDTLYATLSLIALSRNEIERSQLGQTHLLRL